MDQAMARSMLALVLVCAGAVGGAQTLREELQKAGIPVSSFSSAELVQGVNAANAQKDASIYLIYMRVDARNRFTGFPQAVRFEHGSGKVVRRELVVHDEEICCGSPLGIAFTHNYQLFEFHVTPSASVTIVADGELKPVEMLYGFGVREVAPDQVIFTENMVHFAPAHPERIMLANLRTGAARELYPPRGDALRVAFARDHEAKMPPQTVCAAMNDPCDPDYFDEDVEWASGNRTDRFVLRVSRNAVHAMKNDEEPDVVLSSQGLYLYERRPEGWFYCGVALTGGAEQKADCSPERPVQADEHAEDPGLFVRKVK
jgi:hypothetical protein